MGIISFASAKLQKTSSLSQDWSQQEIADFYRAHRLLVENGAGIGIDRGLSDDGEPWMVFFDATSHDVFLHIARIDGRCLLICEPLNMRLFAADISSLITEFEQSIREYLSVKSDLASNVVVHPAARIIMSISAVFLLVKLDNNQAMAQDTADADELPEVQGGVARSAEKTALVTRVQKATARIFELADSPANVALLAGIILAEDFAFGNNLFAPEAVKGEVAAHAQAELPVLPIDAADQLKISLTEINTPQTVVSSEKLSLLSVLEPEAVGDHIAVSEMKFVPQDETPQIERLVVATEDESAQRPNASVLIPSKKATEEKSDDGKSTLIDEPQTYDSAQISKPEIVEPTPVVKGIGDITAGSLGTVDSVVGVLVKTDFDVSKMYAIIRYLTDNMSKYSSDYLGGRVLYEEDNVENLAAADVGLWTNTLGDDSTFSIIGRADLIDDVLTLFT